MAKKNELVEQSSQVGTLVTSPAQEMVKQFECQQRMAQMYVSSTIVPQTYRGNVGNCVIAIDMAMRMGVNPLMVMQNLYIVHGNPGWSSKFLISCINMCGRFTPLRYQFYGQRGTDLYACRAYAYERGDHEHKEALIGTWITIDMAKREGWFNKDGSKWKTMPEQMMRYRAAAFWQRAYAPEISMGFLTKEEIEDAVVVEEIPVGTPPIGDEPVPEVDNVPDAAESAVKEEVKDEQPKEQSKKPSSAKDTIKAAINKQQKVDTETGELFNEQQS